MPQRFLRPGITDSDKWNSVSEPAQNLFIRLLTRVDDFGRFDGRPAVIVGSVYSVWNALNPMSARCPHDVSVMLSELYRSGLIILYENGGKRFLQLEQWTERQRVASKWPDPKDKMSAPCPHDAVTVTAPCPPPSPSPSPSPSPKQIGLPQKTPESEPKQPLNGKFVKPTVEEMMLHGAKIGLPNLEVERCHAYYESNGWRVGKNPMKSWQGAMVNWRGNWQSRNPHLPTTPTTPPAGPRPVRKMEYIQPL